MSDPTPNDPQKANAPHPDEHAAAVESAKPLAPRPRPAFTRKQSGKKPQNVQATAVPIDLSEIPEAVPLQDIPEGIPAEPVRKTMQQPRMRTPGNQPVRPKSLPKNLIPETPEPEAPVEKQPIDKSRFASFDNYENGETAVKPLEKAPGVESRQVQRIERPKFLDGELSRTIERGVQYPQPGRLIWTSIILLVFKVTLLLNIVALPLVAIFAKDAMHYALLLPAALVLTGIMFTMSAHRTRCRICSCHMFYNRRCFKHQKAHRLFGLGHGGSAALHALLFKWLRCMYCGTAIRLRPPKADSEEAQVNRAANEQKPKYDKSLIRPRK